MWCLTYWGKENKQEQKWFNSEKEMEDYIKVEYKKLKS